MDKVHKSAEGFLVGKGIYPHESVNVGEKTIYWSTLMEEYASQKGNVWVKVSEKPLPEKNKHFNGRFNGKPAIVWDSRLIEGYVTVNGNLERTENVEWLDEQPQATTITEGNVEESFAIVKKLADWSIKYPRGPIYPMYRKNMDDELIEIEKEAKEFMAQWQASQVNIEDKK